MTGTVTMQVIPCNVKITSVHCSIKVLKIIDFETPGPNAIINQNPRQLFVPIPDLENRKEWFHKYSAFYQI